uniref:Putative secreted protein n=1 Tax=Ixodes ricinus TaxID=34613 RepID=A0A6B0U680_IXORI
MGVFFSLLFATAAVGWSPGALSGPGGAHSPPGLGLNMLRRPDRRRWGSVENKSRWGMSFQAPADRGSKDRPPNDGKQ